MSLCFHRASGGPPMEFEFVTDAGSVMQILKLWNIRLLESIPPSQPEFNTTPTITSKHNSSKERRSFRTPKAAPLVPDNDLKRAGSFSKMHTLGTGQLVGGTALPGRRSWGGSNEIYPPPVTSGSQLSQESVFNSLTSPPPLPPRPEESDSDDPDYSYIDENKVKGPESQRGRSRTMSSGMAGGRVSSPTLDDQLEELKKSIMRENKKKKRDKAASDGRKAATLHFPPRSSPRSRLPMNFVRAEPEDYLEPVASKRLTSTSSEGVPKRDKLSPNIDNFPRSLSDHAGNANNSSSSSIGTAQGEVFDDSQSPPDIHTHSGSTSNIIGSVGAVGGAVGVVGPGGNPPALPPRPWRNSSVTSVSSVSSATSPSNSILHPLANPPAGNRPSISEERSTIEEEKRSPILGSPKESRQARNTEQSAVVGSNGDQMGSKDGSISPIDVGSSSVSPPPPLPPRSPTRDRERLSRKSSSSSASSNTSSSHRCPRCRSLKKTKPMVGKTASLDPRGGIQGPVQNLTKEENRKSLPDLNNASPFPENNLALDRQHHGHSMSREHNHGHSCSKCSVGSSTDGFPGGAATSNGSLPASSSSQNFEYLQLLSEEGERRVQLQQQQVDIDTDVSPALDLLSSCLQDLEYLENKVNQQSNNSPPNSGSLNQLKNSHKSAAAIANEQRRMAVQTDIDAAMRQTELVQADLNISRRSIRPVSSVGPEETRKMVANGHPPLLKKHNTVNAFSSHSSSTSPSPPASGGPASSGNGSSSAPLHWTQQPHPPQSSGRPTNLANSSMTRNSSSSSLVSNPANIVSPLSIQSPNPVFSPVNTPNMGGAPPVPPRSLVSLGGEVQQPPPSHAWVQQPHGHPMMGRSFSQTSARPHTQQRGLSKSNSLGRHVGTWKTAIYGDPHHAPQRSPSASGMVGVGGPSPAAFHNQNHIDSQTVFVHHLNRSGSRHARQMQAHLV